MSLKNSSILITGATSGFGAATARLLAKKWPEARLLLVGRRQDRLAEMVRELGPERAVGIPLDISQRKAVELFAVEQAAELARVAVLVNNAGLAAGLDAFPDASLDDWDQMIDTNVKGLLYVTRLTLPHMLARGEGHIVNLGSIAGHAVYPKGHVYNATKFAVRALNAALRLDLLGRNIRVTSVDPGMAETEFSQVDRKSVV